MNITKDMLGKYLNTVSAKIDDPKTIQRLQFGTCSVPGAPQIRSSVGMNFTKALIMKSAENLFLATNGRDDLCIKMNNFSEATGYNAVTDVNTIGAIDVTIMALAQSLIPYVAVDRPMASDTDTIFFQDLVANNTAGGVSEGDVVSGNFTVPNPLVNLGPARTDSQTSAGTIESGVATYTVDAAGPVIKGRTTVSIYLNGTVLTVTGKDYESNGVLIFPDGKTTGTVNNATGEISVSTTQTTSGATKVVTTYKLDQAGDGTGSTTLKVSPKWSPVALVSDPENIIVEDNLANRMYMSKIQLIANGTTSPTQSDVVFGRTKNTYIEYLNVKVINELIANAVQITKVDLSDYDLGSWAVTKNDLVTQMMTNLCAGFMGKSGLPVTSILAGTYGVAMLECIPVLWVKNPEITNGMNGLAGFFNGVAVYRHNSLDVLGVESGQVAFYACNKSPDNNVGSLVYGEYLPITSTGVVSNYNMPTNISTGFFSQTAVKKIVNHLVRKAVLVLPAKSGGATADLFGNFLV